MVYPEKLIDSDLKIPTETNSSIWLRNSHNGGVPLAMGYFFQDSFPFKVIQLIFDRAPKSKGNRSGFEKSWRFVRFNM